MLLSVRGTPLPGAYPRDGIGRRSGLKIHGLWHVGSTPIAGKAPVV
jgi:hypothetical protein